MPAMGVRVCILEDESGAPHIKHRQRLLIAGKCKETYEVVRYKLEQD